MPVSVEMSSDEVATQICDGVCRLNTTLKSKIEEIIRERNNLQGCNEILSANLQEVQAEREKLNGFLRDRYGWCTDESGKVIEPAMPRHEFAGANWPVALVEGCGTGAAGACLTLATERQTAGAIIPAFPAIHRDGHKPKPMIDMPKAHVTTLDTESHDFAEGSDVQAFLGTVAPCDPGEDF